MLKHSSYSFFKSLQASPILFIVIWCLTMCHNVPLDEIGVENNAKFIGEYLRLSMLSHHLKFCKISNSVYWQRCLVFWEINDCQLPIEVRK